MNIYNDSNAVSQTSYPTNPIFTNIDTQDVIIRNNLQITGASLGGLIMCEDNLNNIGELVLGPQDFILASDKNNTSLPIWRNNISLNEIQTNQLKIPTIVQGDLLVGQNTNYLGRLPCGAFDTVLYSDGSNLGWLSTTSGNTFYNNAGVPNNITLNVLSVIYSVSALDFIAGKRYRINISGRVASQGTTGFILTFNGATIAVFNYIYDNDMSRTVIYNPAITGSVTLELQGLTNIVNSSIFDFCVTSEQF